MKQKILDISQIIRDKINKSKIFREIYQDEQKFNVCCAALDVIEDAEEAISYYKNVTPNDDIGYKYIMLFGLLESMYIQQNALNSLGKALGMNIQTESSRIKYIRDIRNDIAGHPTDRNGNETVFLNRNLMEHNSFSYNTSNSDEYIEIDVFKLIEDQENYIYDCLQKVSENII